MTKKMFTSKGRKRGGVWLAALCVAAVMLAAVLPVVASAAATGGQAQYIGETAAKSVALKHAGVTEAQATFLKVHLDYDDRRVVYDVEFYSGNTEYDYEIDAVSGEIYEFDREIEYYSIPNRSSTTTNAGQYIGEAAAKSAALKHAGVTAAQATFVKAYLEDDDGLVVYDIEFYSGNTEYDYEIDAVSGEIYEFDKEIEYYTIPKNSAGSSGRTGNSVSAPAGAANYIGEAKAKSVALTHAGLTESRLTRISVRLDYDDGRVDYEVDFYADNTEYEYEIDAVSGDILEFDRETNRRGNSGSVAAGGQTAASANTGDYIGEARAKSVALADAGLVESQVRRMKVKLDRDHGQMIYEVEFKSGRMEYEYEIDAVSGAILESDTDYDD